MEPVSAEMGPAEARVCGWDPLGNLKVGRHHNPAGEEA
jgi:hypothetical protein